jgi:hypothetical protein
MKLGIFELICIALLIIQVLITGSILMLDPIQQQEGYALLLASDFVITAMFLYLYLNEGSEYDEEWLAIGITFFVIILLTILFLIRVF